MFENTYEPNEQFGESGLHNPLNEERHYRDVLDLTVLQWRNIITYVSPSKDPRIPEIVTSVNEKLQDLSDDTDPWASSPYREKHREGLEIARKVWEPLLEVVADSDQPDPSDLYARAFVVDTKIGENYRDVALRNALMFDRTGTAFRFIKTELAVLSKILHNESYYKQYVRFVRSLRKPSRFDFNGEGLMISPKSGGVVRAEIAHTYLEEVQPLIPLVVDTNEPDVLYGGRPEVFSERFVNRVDEITENDRRHLNDNGRIRVLLKRAFDKRQRRAAKSIITHYRCYRKSLERQLADKFPSSSETQVM